MLKKIVIPFVIVALGVMAYVAMNTPKSRTTAIGAIPTQTTSESTDPGSTARKTRPEADLPAEQPDTETGNVTADNATGSPSSARQNTSQGTRGGMIGGLTSGQLAQQGATSVDVIPAKATMDTAQLKLFGEVTPRRQIDMTATSNATVVDIVVREGESVVEGQLLAQLQSENAQQTLVQRQAALAEITARIRNEQRKHENDVAALAIDEELLSIAKNTVERLTSLGAQQLSTSTDYENALRSYQTQLQQVQARRLLVAQYEDVQLQLAAQQQQLTSQLAVVEQQVKELAVTAPFNGVVAKLDLIIGQEVRTGQALATVYDPQRLEVRARSPLRYRLDQYPLEQLTALGANEQWQVVSVRPMNEMGAQQIALVPTQTSAQLPLPGTYVELTLSYPLSAPAIAVPVTAVYDQQRVYLANRGQLKAVDVDIVGRSGESYLITSEDMGDRDMIVTTRMNNPTTGMAISVLDRQGVRP